MTRSGDGSDAALGSGVLRLPEAGSPGGSSSDPPSSSTPLTPISDFGLGSRETTRFSCVKHSSSTLLQKPQERNSVFKTHLSDPSSSSLSGNAHRASPVSPGILPRRKGCGIMLIGGRHGALPKTEEHQT